MSEATTDRELLELAAKAFWAGDECTFWFDASEGDGGSIVYIHADNQDHNGQDRELVWNPLADDADALRLAVKLWIWLDYSGCSYETPARVTAHYLGIRGRKSSNRWVNEPYVPEEMFTSDYMPNRTHAEYQLEQGLVRGLEAATRRAITRAAAAIGKEMK